MVDQLETALRETFSEIAPSPLQPEQGGKRVTGELLPLFWHSYSRRLLRSPQAWKPPEKGGWADEDWNGPRRLPMIWVLLGLLGIPLWFIVAILIAVFRNRHRVKNAKGVFEFKSQTDSGWRRRKSYGRWVSNVLILHLGPGLIRTDPIDVSGVSVVGDIEPAPKGMDRALVVEVHPRTGDPLTIAVAADDGDVVLGPFPGI